MIARLLLFIALTIPQSAFAARWVCSKFVELSDGSYECLFTPKPSPKRYGKMYRICTTNAEGKHIVKYVTKKSYCHKKRCSAKKS